MKDEAIKIDGAIASESLYGMRREPTYAGVLSFLRRNYSKDLTGVDLVVSGVPFDLGVTYRPGAFRTASNSTGIGRSSVAETLSLGF